MRLHFSVFIIASVTLLVPGRIHAQMKPWNNAGVGLSGLSGPPKGPSGPAPRRDLSGIWDAGAGGIQPTGYDVAALFTPLGEKMAKANKPGNGPRIADVSEDNDPLSTLVTRWVAGKTTTRWWFKALAWTTGRGSIMRATRTAPACASRSGITASTARPWS